MIIEELRQEVEKLSNRRRNAVIVIVVSAVIGAVLWIVLSRFWDFFDVDARTFFCLFCLMSLSCSIGLGCVTIGLILERRASKKRLQHWQKIAASEDETIKTAYNKLLELEEKINAPELLRKERDVIIYFIDSLAK